MKAQLLLVEDNGDDEVISIRAIRMAAQQVEIKVARDGAEAAEALGLVDDGPCQPPDLVLLDLKLPKMSGLTLLRLIRDRPALNGVPIVVLTSSDEPSDVAECKRLGVQDYVQKPVDYRLYMSRVGQVVCDFFPGNKAR